MDVILRPIVGVIEEAGKRLRYVSDAESDYRVKNKGGDDANMVTVYDVRTQDFLIEEIRKIIPDAVFIAEEQDNDRRLLSAKHCFIIDPIDGTANFVHGYRHSSISVAMLSLGELVFGAVYNPYLDEMFYAVKGEGAYLSHSQIAVAQRPIQKSIIGFGSSPYRKDELADSTFAVLRELYRSCSDVRRSGSAALELCYVAAGRTDGFYELSLSAWDFAAGTLIVKEAGGLVTDASGGEVRFDGCTSIIAGAPSVHNYIMKTIKKVLKDEV